MKKSVAGILSAMLLSLSFGSGYVSADEGINEMWGVPVFVYGGALSEGQIGETKELLGIKEGTSLEEVDITGDDLVRLLEQGNPDANMYSSALIEHSGKTSGVIVQVVTPENITGVTTTQYANALITAGATDVSVKVASPVKVTGHSALTGVYKAYETQGVEFDKDRMQVAQEELDTVTSIANENEGNEDFNAEALNQALIDIKTELAGLKKSKDEEITKEDIERIINEALKKNKLENSITDAQIAQLVSFAEKYQNTGAIFSEDVKNQLNDLAGQVKDNIKNGVDKFGNAVMDTLQDEGFWDGVKEFFSNLIDMIGGWFTSSDEEVVE